MKAGRILLAGASGFVGERLREHFGRTRRDFARLVRTAPRSKNEFYWNPAHGIFDRKALEGVGAVICLSGATVFGRWTEAKKREIFESRVPTVRFLAGMVARSGTPPEVFLSVSAVGYYGTGAAGYLDETAPAGSGFLADICSQWEEPAAALKENGVRVVFPRLGTVLGREGGVLKKLVPLFRMGLGGKLGCGSQPFPWIAAADVAPAFELMMKEKLIEGPVNTVSPSNATNSDFTDALARALGRKAVLGVPAFALRAVFGGMADELLLGGAKIVPSKLLAAGFRFRHADLESVLSEEIRVS